MMLHILNDVANDAESTQEIETYVIIASLKRETIGKLTNTTFDIKFHWLGFENACKFKHTLFQLGKIHTS